MCRRVGVLTKKGCLDGHVLAELDAVSDRLLELGLVLAGEGRFCRFWGGKNANERASERSSAVCKHVARVLTVSASSRCMLAFVRACVRACLLANRTRLAGKEMQHGFRSRWSVHG